MTPPKLSESDKEAILTIYQSSEETASTLALRYGVSNTTISRILKSGLSESDYDALVQQKRSARSGVGAELTAKRSLPVLQSAGLPSSAVTESSDVLLPQVASEVLPVNLASPTVDHGSMRESTTREPGSKLPPPIQHRRQRSSSGDRDELEALPTTQLELPTSPSAPEMVQSSFQQSDTLMDSALVEMIAEEFSTSKPRSAEFEDDSDFDEEFDDEEDEDDLDEDDSDNGLGITLRHTRQDIPLQVLPLSEALIPRTFYLVVDHAAELVTRPLQDFGDLGQIPLQDVQAETLPIFDNHRVARRFSKKTQRVVKVPDGRMLEKVGPYLQAKGITRLLIDGQVYSFD